MDEEYAHRPELLPVKWVSYTIIISWMDLRPRILLGLSRARSVNAGPCVRYGVHDRWQCKIAGCVDVP